MRVLLFGGTTEGRILAERLSALPVQLTVSTATQLGREELSDVSGCTILTGRKDQNEIAQLLSGFDLCVDATHPYAIEVTANIHAACETAGVPLYRLLRATSPVDGVITVEDCAAAAAFLQTRTGNILLTTGTKTLSAFSALDKHRLFARVLPTHESLAACEAIGLAHKNILALQGPFTQKMNEAMLEQYRIAWMVTKDGGGPGGFAEKLAAAQQAGVGMILISRPVDTGKSLEEIMHIVEGALACR
ncbi:MAG: precorrin-6A reductase [Oscillospiraceae bacterium]|jgi:precorrin-6A/cobalt-precorrin-6A reductase